VKHRRTWCALLQIFRRRDLGITRCLLGIVFERNKETGSIKSTQPELLQDIVELLGLQPATRRETPLPAETVLEIGTAPTLDAHAMSLYMTGLGKLNYMAQTRPDIAYAVNGLAHFQQRATTVHLQSLRHVARSLVGTRQCDLVFRQPCKTTITNVLMAVSSVFSDADHAGDVETRRSTIGWIVLLYGTAIAW
jgi:hypothetical protein